MAKVTVDIPDKAIDEHTSKKIKQLEDKLVRAERKIKKLEYKIKEQKNKEELANGIVGDVRSFINNWTWEVDAEQY